MRQTAGGDKQQVETRSVRLLLCVRTQRGRHLTDGSQLMAAEWLVGGRRCCIFLLNSQLTLFLLHVDEELRLKKKKEFAGKADCQIQRNNNVIKDI